MRQPGPAAGDDRSGELYREAALTRLSNRILVRPSLALPQVVEPRSKEAIGSYHRCNSWMLGIPCRRSRSCFGPTSCRRNGSHRVFAPTHTRTRLSCRHRSHRCGRRFHSSPDRTGDRDRLRSTRCGRSCTKACRSRRRRPASHHRIDRRSPRSSRDRIGNRHTLQHTHCGRPCTKPCKSSRHRQALDHRSGYCRRRN